MVKRFFWNLYFLIFLNGFLLATLFYFKMEANYEKEVFQAIHSDLDNKISLHDSQDSMVAKVMHACHNLLRDRESIFEGKSLDGIKAGLLHPASVDLMTADGACSSFSYVLARLLEGYNYPVRIAQMKAKGEYAKHNVVEVETRHGWAVLDPLYDLYFIKPDHQLASFADIKNNWDYYRHQLPPGYDMGYHYEDVRYSNWTKIPVILPAIKKILDLTLGKAQADVISVRTYFLKMYDICFDITLGLFIIVFLLTFLKLIQTKVFPQKNIPVTFSNIYKYLRMRFTDWRMRGQSHA